MSAPAKPEWKAINGANSVLNMAVVGTVSPVSMNNIAQGATEDRRIGLKCLVKKLHIRFTISLLSTNVTVPAVPVTSNACRILIILDKQANGAGATVLDVMTEADINSNFKVESKRRFRVLWDRRFSMNAPGMAFDTAPNQWVTCSAEKTMEYKKILNIPIWYDGATGVIGEVMSNNLLMITFRQFDEPTCIMDYSFRTWFTG